MSKRKVMQRVNELIDESLQMSHEQLLARYVAVATIFARELAKLGYQVDSGKGAEIVSECSQLASEIEQFLLHWRAERN